MKVSRIAVTNAANPSLFMVDVSPVVMCQYQQDDPNISILDLKAHYRGSRYMMEDVLSIIAASDVIVSCNRLGALGR